MPVDNLKLYNQRCEFLRKHGKGHEVERAIFNALNVVYAITIDSAITIDFGHVPVEDFGHDFSKDGKFRLVKTMPPLTGCHKFDIVPILKSSEDPICSEEMFRRARELGAGFIGQTEAEKILKHQEKIPRDRRNQFILFTGTTWESTRDHKQYLPYIRFDGNKWVMDLLLIQYCGGLVHVLVPCKSLG